MEPDQPIELGIDISRFIRYKVMLVDKSKVDREHIRRILLRKKFNIFSELDSYQEILPTMIDMLFKPDLIMMDCDNLDMEYLEVIHEIRDLYPKIKIVILTSNSGRELIKGLLPLKIDAFILKPLNNDKIIDKLAKIFGRNELIYNKEIVVNKKNYIKLNDVKIPPLSNVVYNVLTFDTEDPELGINELENIVASDKSISAGIIRLANSSFYGRSGKIHTLKDAITLLGIKTIKNLVFLFSKKKFNSSLQSELYVKFLQELPILTALVAFDLSSPLGMKKIGETVFLSALLRKIGMTILAINCVKQYAEVLKIYEFGVKNLYDIEEAKFTINSIQMGEKVFKYWKMPDIFLDVINNQNFSLEDLAVVSDVDRITRLAEILSLKMMNVTLLQTETEMETKILERYGKSKDIKDMFGAAYYEIIQDHPLYSLALG
ncbi:MAG: HDOD domain-containing protein [Leptospiraceae bacterium]|nr:HDOD domain-containing protein [Leptospiraceae bacterium]